MKRLLCLFSTTLLVLTSCSSNDDNDSSKDSSILPKKVTVIDSDGDSSTETILYNGNKIVSITEENGSVVRYTYTGDLITREEDIDEKGELDDFIEYTYTNGKLANSIEKSIGDEFYYKVKYTHNVDGTVSYDQFRGVVSTGVEEEYGATGKYTFKDGNLVKLDVSYYGSDRSYVYEYDTRNNPLKNVLGYNLLLEDADSSLNNVVKETGISGSGTNISTNTVTNTYKYDANNYPTEKVRSYQSGTSISTQTTQYLY